MTSEAFYACAQPRETVEIHLPDGMVLCRPRGATAEEFIRQLDRSDQPPIVGAIVDGNLRELTFPIMMDAKVRPVTMGDADGMRIYRRSLTFLLETAFEKRYPDATLVIDHSVSSGGYFCHVTGHAPLKQSELEEVEADMRALVAGNLPFKRQLLPLDEASAYFEENGFDDKVRLLAHRTKDYLTVYQLDGHLDYHHGYMLPSSGYLRWFGLVRTGEGFTLRFPRRHKPTELLPLPEYPKLLATFRQYGDWLWRLGISSVGALDDAIEFQPHPRSDPGLGSPARRTRRRHRRPDSRPRRPAPRRPGCRAFLIGQDHFLQAPDHPDARPGDLAVPAGAGPLFQEPGETHPETKRVSTTSNRSRRWIPSACRSTSAG